MADKDTGVKARLNIASRAKAVPLSKFLRHIKKRRGLSRLERVRILEQTILLLEMSYVHLPLKRAMHAINPLQRLRLLKYRLETERKMEDEMQFHHRLVEIFSSLRDIHTSYLLPSPFRAQTAFLPFLIEQYFNAESEDRYLVSRVDRNHLKAARKSDTTFFEPGVEVLYWNGIPIKRAIEMNGERQAGSNTEARFARGLDSLTIRPLRTSLPPNEEWVEITYRDLNGKTRRLQQDWLVYQAQPKPSATKTSKKNRAAVDVLKTKINQVKRELFAPGDVPPTEPGFEYIFYKDVREVSFAKLGSKKSGYKRVGYLRLFSFEVDDQEAFVDAIRKVVTAEDFPQDGLILDVRGNGGGRIRAGERLLQLFTPHSIKPELFEFINTPLNLEICRSAPEDLGLSLWAQSIAESVVTGATYSMGFPLTSEAECNDVGQVYFGPVVLVTDALSYSTTDMFAAGFQDNQVGEILGASGNTGAGGANVWGFQDFMRNTRNSSKASFKPLPRDTNLNVAIRRSIRVGQREGRPLEELGITPNHRYRMSKRDIMDHNKDLIAEAARILHSNPVYSLKVDPVGNKDQTIQVSASSKTRRANERKAIRRIDISIDGAPYKSFKADKGLLPATEVVFEAGNEPINVQVKAFDYDNNAVAAYRYR